MRDRRVLQAGGAPSNLGACARHGRHATVAWSFVAPSGRIAAWAIPTQRPNLRTKGYANRLRRASICLCMLKPNSLPWFDF